jgi:glycerol-3-phosphate acyltransferase PlsY
MPIDTTLLMVLLVALFGYLLGSFPTAYVIGRLKDINIFEVGSGNMGGTNIARSMGAKWGVLVYAIDILKGIVAIWIATTVILPGNQPAAAVAAAIAVVIGHNWSLFVAVITGTLRGGKGAATALGTMLMVAPLPVLLVMALVGVVVILSTRYVSLAVLVMVAIAAPWMLILVGQHALPIHYTVYTLFITAILLWRFRENIRRLLAGTERRLGERA